MEFLISVPPQFSFRRTVLSHGWCELAPFKFDNPAWRLSRVIDLEDGRVVFATISEADGAIKVEATGRLGSRATAKFVRTVRHMLRLDDDLTLFHDSMAADPEFAWVAREGAGRLLRAPTVFEDLVKMICTTNCSWALTEAMVNGMVNSLGIPSGNGGRSFPSAEVIARQTDDFFRTTVRAGYRAPYLRELAERVASSDLDVEGWLTTELSTAELKREIKAVKGVGDYVAENMLRLLGRYDGLALDSWLRGKFAKVRNGGRTATDKKIGRFYSRFGDWCGLAMWCDMTRDWITEDQFFK
jgi:3-methyladenine DNA glycosylase/8-oxoguanine DNA glycosylase